MEIIISWFIHALAIIIATRIFPLPGVHVDTFTTALAVALVLGIINAFIKPILIFFTLPINVLTLGLFTFIINALLILLTSSIVAGFKVDGFWWALIFSIILSVINSILGSLTRVKTQ